METMLEAIASVKRIDAGPFDLATKHLAHVLLENAALAFREHVLDLAAYQMTEDEYTRLRVV